MVDFLWSWQEGGTRSSSDVAEVLETFRSGPSMLILTNELIEDRSIRFLDLKLTFSGSHVCWKYEPREKKKAHVALLFYPFEAGENGGDKFALKECPAEVLPPCSRK